jgi:hypothetical protein
MFPGSNCDMVTPLSTRLGKGTWGQWEGAEVYFNLSQAAGAFVSNALNYQRVQVRLTTMLSPRPRTAVPASQKVAFLVKNPNTHSIDDFQRGCHADSSLNFLIGRG